MLSSYEIKWILDTAKGSQIWDMFWFLDSINKIYDNEECKKMTHPQAHTYTHTYIHTCTPILMYHSAKFIMQLVLNQPWASNKPDAFSLANKLLIARVSRQGVSIEKTNSVILKFFNKHGDFSNAYQSKKELLDLVSQIKNNIGNACFLCMKGKKLNYCVN